MRALVFTLICLACSIAAAATVYRWVDENGVIHYSDQPHEKAEKVQVKAPQTYTAPKSPAVTRSSTSSKPDQAQAYQSCAITEPTAEQVFMNTDTVTAGVSVQPAIRPGDTAVVMLDGQRVPGVPASGGQFTISPVYRGTHSIRMTVQDPNGATVCSSASVTFYVQQPSLLNPQRPIKPH